MREWFAVALSLLAFLVAAASFYFHDLIRIDDVRLIVNGTVEIRGTRDVGGGVETVTITPRSLRMPSPLPWRSSSSPLRVRSLKCRSSASATASCVRMSKSRRQGSTACRRALPRARRRTRCERSATLISRSFRGSNRRAGSGGIDEPVGLNRNHPARMNRRHQRR